MSINRTAEYVVLWKSHKRAEWAAVGLDNQAAALRQQLARNDANALLSSPPAASTGEYLSTEKATEKATETATGTTTETAAETTMKMAAKVATNIGAVAVAQRVAPDLAAPSVDVLAEISDELEFLENESRHMWQLSAEIGAELAQTEALLTFAQRQKAEQMLKQWEESGAGL